MRTVVLDANVLMLALAGSVPHHREVHAPFRVKTVGKRTVDGGDIWEAVRQLTETAEQIRGSRALVPRGVYRFVTFEEAHEWMMEKIASTHASHGRKILRKSARR